MPYFTTRGIIPLAGGGGGGGFTPASLANLLVWYKADAGVYSDAGSTLATNGQGVVQWNDQENTYHGEQAGASGNRLIYTTGALNGLPVLVGNTDATRCVFTDENVPLGGSTLSIFAVVKVQSGLANMRLVSIATTAQGDVGANTTTIATDVDGNPYTYSSGFLDTQTISVGTWNVIGSVWTGTQNEMYVNGTGSGSAVATTMTFASAVSIGILGEGVSGSSAADASVAEVVITTNALTTEIAQLQTYFVAKWGTMG